MEKRFNTSFWFMRDNHTFIKVEANTVESIVREMFEIAKENPHGMVCPVIISEGETEYERYKVSAHVTGNGTVDLTDWTFDVKHAITKVDLLNAELDEVRERATEFFEEYLEGEPLTHSSVIEGLIDFSKEEIRRYETR